MEKNIFFACFLELHDSREHTNAYNAACEVIMRLFHDGKSFTRFPVEDFFRNCEQIPRKLRLSSHTQSIKFSKIRKI